MKNAAYSIIFLAVFLAFVVSPASWAIDPTACFTVTNSGACGTWTVNASCSTNVNSGTTYVWYFDDGGTTAQIFSGKTVTRNGLASGPWRVTLVADNNGISSGQSNSATSCFWVCCIGPCGGC